MGRKRFLLTRKKEIIMDNDKQSFWDHLDVLRAAIIRIVAVTVIFGVLAFFLRNNCSLSFLLQKIPDS